MHGRLFQIGELVRYGPCQQRGHHVGADRKAKPAEGADDLRLHVVDLGFQHQHALVESGFGLRVGLHLAVVVIPLGGLSRSPMASK